MIHSVCFFIICDEVVGVFLFLHGEHGSNLVDAWKTKIIVLAIAFAFVSDSLSTHVTVDSHSIEFTIILLSIMFFRWFIQLAFVVTQHPIIRNGKVYFSAINILNSPEYSWYDCS